MNTFYFVKKTNLCIYILLVCILLSNPSLSKTSEQFSKTIIDKSISQPQIIGPSKGEVYKYYSFNANCLDSINEQIWYRFDFDGEITDWQQTPEISFSWIKPSIIDIKVQAKNSKSILSLWSQPHSIQIEKIDSKPSIPLILGDSDGSINQSLTYKTKSIDPDGNIVQDNIQYQFDWGDNTKSDWFYGQNQWVEKSHTWLKPGQFCMTVQSKDISGLLSDTSPCKTITIIGPNQSPNTPSLAGISLGYINQSYLFHATAIDDNEDKLEYSFVIYLQDQTFASDWQTSPDFSWTWHSPGTFCIKAVVRDASGRTPVWSKCHDVKILSEPTSCQVDIVSPNPDNEHYYNICNGGYVITSGSFKITWQDMDGNKDDDINRIEAFYAIANNEWQPFGVDNSPNGDFDAERWTIPQNFFHERVRFKISAFYDSGCISKAISKPIQLHNSNQPEIIIEQPISGVYYVGEPVPIKWKANCPDNFSITRIELKLIADGNNRGSFTELSGQDALKSFYSWKPRSSHITNQGQIRILVWCSNCIDGESVSSATFQIKYRPDPSNPWKEAQQPMTIPNPSNYQLPSIIEPDIHVDANQTIHLVSCYIALKDSSTLPIIGESQLYYRKQINGVWLELENATSYPVWQSPDYTWSDNQYQVRYPKITADSNGRPHIVYELESPNNQTDIMYITKNETGWTKPYNISNTSDNKSIDAQITIDHNNAITIFWEEQKSGIYFRKYSYGKWSPIAHVPVLYDNYNVNSDDNHIIYMVGHNIDSVPFYTYYDGDNFFTPQQITQNNLSSKPFIIKTSNHIKVSSGSQFSFFTHINDQWIENHQQFTEEKADGLLMFEDSNNRIHVVYKGLHEGQTIMLERIEQDGVWSDYYPISSYRADHYYAADGYENLMATAWEGRGDIFMSYADFSNVSFGPVIRNFSAQPVSGDMPLMVNFQTDIIEGSVPLSDIHIQFGDGDRASGNQSYTHIYNQAGKYSAYIQVRDESGNIAFQEKQIHVLDPTYYNVGLTIQPDKSGFIYGDLDCSDNCQSSVRESQTIQLTQQSENGYTFSHWTGCDQTNQGSCVVTTNHEKNISAHFVCLTPEIPEIETLSGQVIQSSHQYIIHWMPVLSVHSYIIEESLFTDFSSIESQSVVSNHSMTYTHTVNENTNYYYRVRAISNCSQSDWSQPVKIRIALPRYTLNVQSTPINGGYIADHQVNHFIFCPMNQCMSDYYENALITLFATPYPEFSIKEWAGCEKIQNNQCIVTMNKHQNVRVSFKCNDIHAPEMTTLIKEIKPNEPYILVWNEVPGAIQYELEESTSPDFSKNIHTINTTDLSQVFIKEQLWQSEFFYRASAMRSCGSQSEWSNVIRLNKGIRSKQNIDLQSGWNWISISVNPNENNWTIHSVLSAISSHAEKLISQKGYSEFNQEWFGTITHVQPALMYMLKMNVSDRLIIEGNPLEADYEFALQKGWNWIGFWKDQPVLLNTALQEIGDSGEKIVSQRGFAEYHQGWWGSCDMLIPGNGYMLKIKEPKKIGYSFNSGLNRKNKSNNNLPDKISDWTMQASNYEFQGTFTIKLECRTMDNISENDWFGAFINNECRGAANAVQTPNGMLFFLQVWANDNDLPITFKFFSANENCIYPVKTNPILFVANMEMGRIDAPVVFKVDDWYEDVNKDDILDLKDVILILKDVGGVKN